MTCTLGRDDLHSTGQRPSTGVTAPAIEATFLRAASRGRIAVASVPVEGSL